MDRGMHMSCPGDTAHEWREVTVFPRVALPRLAVEPFTVDDFLDAGAALVDACCDEDSLVSEKT